VRHARAAGRPRRILFLEDIGEEPYRLDRLWTQLVLAGALDGVAGVAFGRFTDCGDACDLLRELARRWACRCSRACPSATSRTTGRCRWACGHGSTPTPARSNCWKAAVT
jgi:hypothetical protein